MSDFVPSIGMARARYCDSIVRKDGVPHSFVVTPEDHAKNHAEFDRMISEVRRQAAEEAWEEGWASAIHGFDLPDSEPGDLAANPYTPR